MSITNTLTLPRQLCELGFTPDGDRYRSNGMTARVHRRWLTLETQAAHGDLADIGGPGLWKTMHGPIGPRREFHLPREVIGHEAWDDETGEMLNPLTELINWALVTASGELPENWICPPQNEMTLPKGAFTVEAGASARQGQLYCETSRLAIRFPLLQTVPDDLSDARRAWLQAILADGQNRCRLVRLVQQQTPEQPVSILAEVDLTGAPQFALPRLLRIGLDALRHLLSQTTAAVELLVDPTVTSTVWEFPPTQDCPAEGGQQ